MVVAQRLSHPVGNECRCKPIVMLYIPPTKGHYTAGRRRRPPPQGTAAGAALSWSPVPRGARMLTKAMPAVVEGGSSRTGVLAGAAGTTRGQARSCEGDALRRGGEPGSTASSCSPSLRQRRAAKAARRCRRNTNTDPPPRRVASASSDELAPFNEGALANKARGRSRPAPRARRRATRR